MEQKRQKSRFSATQILYTIPHKSHYLQGFADFCKKFVQSTRYYGMITQFAYFVRFAGALWSRFGADITKCGFSTAPARPFPAAFWSHGNTPRELSDPSHDRDGERWHQGSCPVQPGARCACGGECAGGTFSRPSGACKGHLAPRISCPHE